MFEFNADSGEVYLYDGIGPEYFGFIDSGTMIRALSQIKGRATVRINSPGGSVDEAIAIYGAMKRHPGGVDVVIDSVAASAASFIALAGERITIAQGGAMMIHSPMFGAIFYANARDLRKYADELDVHEDRVVGFYADRMKKEKDEVKELLAAETWYTADQAVEAGLADAVGDVSAVPTAMPEDMLRRAPESIRIAAVAAQAGSRTPYPIQRIRAGMLLSRAKTLDTLSPKG